MEGKKRLAVLGREPERGTSVFREGGKVILAGWVGVGRKVGLRTVVKV